MRASAELIKDGGTAAASEEFFRSPPFLEAEGVTHSLRIGADEHELLTPLIVRPITTMSKAADEISTGNMEIPELKESGGDEVALLAKSFNRMRRSLEKAIELIDKK